MRKWLSAAALACVCTACGGSGSTEPATPAGETKAETAAPEEKAPAEPVYKEVTLPAGTTLRLDLKSSVASDTSKVEDAVRAALRQAVVVDGKTVLPVGTELAGTVTEVERSGRERDDVHDHVAHRQLRRLDSNRLPPRPASRRRTRPGRR